MVTEIWQAAAASPLTNVTVSATRSSGAYQGMMTIVAFTGASASVDGAASGASASTGAPYGTITSTRAGSWTWGVGFDWDGAAARTVGAGQTKVAEYLVTNIGTFWVQRQTATTPAAGTLVTVNDTAPTNHRWNLSLIEIVPG